jgi:hypothetical protein
VTPNEQTYAIVEAMGMSGPEFSGPSRMRAVASMVERLDQRLQQKIGKGEVPLHRLREFRQGVWPNRKALMTTVRDILAEADAAITAKQEATA